MTRPTSRVLALLEILQSGGTRTAADLADRLEVDERTIRRYIGHLVDLDVPVRANRGRYGGYRLAPGFRMPPLMLTDDEALAVLLSLIEGARSRSVSAALGASETAIAKLRRVLPVSLVRRLDALIDTAEFSEPVPDHATPATEVMLVIAEAARDRHPVALSYTDRGGRDSDRLVDVYGVVAHAGRWYVVGQDTHSDRIRVFRADRISNARQRPGSYEIPIGFDATATVLSEQHYRHHVSVRVRGSASDVRARLPIAVATVEDLDDAGWVRVQIRAERLDWVPALLASLDRPFVIEHPAALRASVRKLANRLTESADAPH